MITPLQAMCTTRTSVVLFSMDILMHSCLQTFTLHMQDISAVYHRRDVADLQIADDTGPDDPTPSNAKSCRPDLLSKTLHAMQEMAAMSCSLPEQQLLRHLAQGHVFHNHCV